MWLYVDLEAPLWVWLLPILIAIGVVAEWRRRYRAYMRQHEEDAQRLVSWQDGLWRRWQTTVARHARHYDAYWYQVCTAAVRVYTEHAGDPHLQAAVRDALRQGASPVMIAHGLAAYHADDPEFVRRFRQFADRGAAARR